MKLFFQKITSLSNHLNPLILKIVTFQFNMKDKKRKILDFIFLCGLFKNDEDLPHESPPQK